MVSTGSSPVTPAIFKTSKSLKELSFGDFFVPTSQAHHYSVTAISRQGAGLSRAIDLSCHCERSVITYSKALPLLNTDVQSITRIEREQPFRA